MVLTEVLNVFEEKLCPEWISWPEDQEKKEIIKHFFEKYKIPGVVGFIDGTHIKIIAPTNRHLYYNRKGNYSLNVMLVCDNQMKIRFVDATHPGASHDSLIWRMSGLRAKMEETYLQDRSSCWLLGDAGYPLEPWLLTPYRTPVEPKQQRFNDAHTKCRNIIERTNGVLKNRWRCTSGARELHYSPKKAVQIVNVCAALHNICIYYKAADDYIGSNLVASAEVEPFESEDVQSHETLKNIAQRIRNDIAEGLLNSID